jgi:hypothetical protein
VVALVVAGAAIVVLSTALSGPARFTSPFGSGGPGLAPVTRPPAPPAGSIRPEATDTALAGTIIEIVLQVLGVAVALVVAVVLIRLIVAAIRHRRRRIGRRGLQGIDPAADPQQVADAPSVLRGIAAALAALDEQREPGDAVVRAWLGLQQAAEDAGVVRSPAETPTEFTGRVLSRTGTDRTALRTLLRLYLGARFGDRAISRADAVSAREALRALEASWEQVSA